MAHLPHMGYPWAKKICHKLSPDLAECISLKLLDGFTPFKVSRPVVVQHHSYLPMCSIWACPWAKNLSNQAALGPDPWIFKVKFWKSCISGMGWPIGMGWKGCESIECWTHAVTFNVHLTHESMILDYVPSHYLNQCWLIISKVQWQSPGPRLNIKTVLSTYGDFHVKDKTAVRTSYL